MNVGKQLTLLAHNTVDLLHNCNSINVMNIKVKLCYQSILGPSLRY